MRRHRIIGWSRGALAPVLLLAVALLVPNLFAEGSYSQYMIELIGVYILASTGLSLSMGLAKQFHVLQTLFMAISAYTVAVLADRYDVPFSLGALAGLAGALLLALLSALVTLRAQTHYLLLATFGIVIVGITLIDGLDSITGGVNGRPAIAGIDIGGFQASGVSREYSLIVLVIAALGLLGARRIEQSMVGNALRGIGLDEGMVAAQGLSPGRYRIVALLISALYGGIAGVLAGPVLGYLSPPSFDMPVTLLLIIMVVIGGLDRVYWVALATVAVTLVQQSAASSVSAWPLAYGLAVMVLIMLPGRDVSRWLPERWRPRRVALDGSSEVHAVSSELAEKGSVDAPR